MNSFKTSTGKRINKSVIDRKIRDAKELFRYTYLEKNGFYFCEKCKKSGGTILDVSHKISVNDAQNSGKTELCWDINNMQLLCRDCHKKHDKLDLKFNNKQTKLF